MINLIQEIAANQPFIWPPVIAWVYGLLSWVTYNLYRLDQAADEYDIDNDGYSTEEVARWWKKHKLKLFISALLLIVGIFEMPTIWGWIFPAREFSNFSYFLAGFLSVALQYLMDKYDKRQ